ncbi:MAG: internal scaffolding protein [Microviridae sp.]|nr:MAG: internal scaffolding protein [Microviridae sp.]
MSKSNFPVATHDFLKSNGLRYADTCTFVEGPSLTRQEFAEECDINSLMARYDTHVIGGPGNLPPAQPIYFDFADAPQTLMEYMQFQKDAEEQFMRLPAVVRKEFDNSALEFVAFATDPGNVDQMVSWGLAAPKPKPQEAPPAAVASSPAPAAAPPPEGSKAP